MTERVGDFVETFQGVAFYPLDARESEINIDDISHSLSLLCRFNGHTKHFYSVAQHSLNVARLIKHAGYEPQYQMLGLLHDATEAYMTDLPRPIKRMLPGYSDAEYALSQVIYSKYGVHGLEYTPIRWADDAMLALEAHALMPCKAWSPKSDVPWDMAQDAGVDLSIDKPLNIQAKFLGTFFNIREEMQNGAPKLQQVRA